MHKALLPAIAMAVMAFTPTSGFSYDAEIGQKQYELLCQSCHGKNGTGDGPYAQKLKIKPSDLTLIAKENGGEFPTDRITKIIDGREIVKAHGDRIMPVWGNHLKISINPKETPKKLEQRVSKRINALVDFIKSIQKP